MKQIQTNNFHSTQTAIGGRHAATVPDRLAGESTNDVFAGISYLPRRKIEQMQADKKMMTPRAIKRKVNTFIEQKVLGSQQATAIMFEELSANTSKLHRHALRQKMDSLEGHQVYPRGQTAETGIRLKMQNSWMRGGLASQSNMNRRESNSQYGYGRDDRPDQTTAASNNIMMSKSGFTHYPGQPLKISQESLLGQTLNKFELGEQDKNKLKQISGVEYYKQHIGPQQQRRLRKYLRDAAGHAPNSKNFIPLSDVAKPSMQGRVKMYMARLNEEEMKEKLKIHKPKTNGMNNDQQMKTASHFENQNNPQLASIQENQKKSGSILESIEGGSPSANRQDAVNHSMFSPSKGTKAFHTVDTESRVHGRHQEKTFSRKSEKGSMRNVSSSMNQINAIRRRKIENSSGQQRNSRLGKSHAHALNKQPHNPLLDSQVFEEDDAEQNFNRQTEDFQTIQNPLQRKSSKRGTVQIVSDFNASLVKQSTMKGAKKSGKEITNAFEMKKVTSDLKQRNLKKQTAIASFEGLSQGERLYKKLQNLKLFQTTDQVAINAQLPLNEEVEKTYREIYYSREKGEKEDVKDKGESKQLKNVKMQKKYLLTYLKKRYTNRLAQKFASIFDWSNGQLEYDVFYQRIEAVLLRPRDIHSEVEHLDIVKKFAFQMFDMNCDQMICETDLFTFLELHKKDEYFQKTLIFDIQDIVQAFRQRNESLVASNKVMSFSDPNIPKIKNLQLYLDNARTKIVQRKEVYQQDIYVSTLIQTPALTNDKQGQSSTDASDHFSALGPAYKRTFNKMMGNSKKGGKKQQIITKDNDASKNHKRDIAEESRREMRSQGAQQFAAEHKKKPQMSFFIHKKDEIYQSKNEKAFLKEDDFSERINFKFGVPLIVLDFIDYVCGSDFIKTVQTFVNPMSHVERFDAQSNDFNDLKGNIDDDFLGYIFQLFNALGEINLSEIGKNVPQDEKESKQYLTLESIQRNLPNVFGIKNDFLAEMLFTYISEHSPLTHKLNFSQFFTRLDVFWKKKKVDPDNEDRASKEWRKRNARQSRKATMRKFIYDFIRLSGGKMVSILDLVKLCCYFKEDSCAFGRESEGLMKKYKQFNIEPKYVHQRQEFGFQQYLKYVPYSCLIEDLEYALCGQIKAHLKFLDTLSDEERRKEEEKQFLTKWKMKSVFDERDLGERFWEQELDRRTGKTAEKDVEVLIKANKKVEEKKIDRGFDIIRTWDIKNIMNEM